MKITRLKRGYRINLSDSEYQALCQLVSWGTGEWEGLSQWDLDCLDPMVKRGLHSFDSHACMAVTDNRR